MFSKIFPMILYCGNSLDFTLFNNDADHQMKIVKFKTILPSYSCRIGLTIMVGNWILKRYFPNFGFIINLSNSILLMMFYIKYWHKEIMSHLKKYRFINQSKFEINLHYILEPAVREKRVSQAMTNFDVYCPLVDILNDQKFKYSRFFGCWHNLGPSKKDGKIET